jgi:hypothetical protein
MGVARADRQRAWRVVGVFLVAAWALVPGGTARAQDAGPPPLQGPVASPSPPLATAPDGPAVAEAPGPATADGPLHEAFLDPRQSPGKIRAPKPPPPPLAERPNDDPPPAGSPAQWVSGYWTWDPSRNGFVWVAGAWRVPQRGRFWVDGTWRRDEAGWYRAPGFWSARRVAATVAAPAPEPPDRSDWRVTGPPADHPADRPGPAPSPDSFYVPGHYTPNPGGGLVWTPGFWADTQPGWDWVPAHWVRRGGGWDYREGYWVRDPAAVDPAVGRHTVARPTVTDDPSNPALPPAIVESKPAGAEPNPGPGREPPAAANPNDADAPSTDRPDPIAARESMGYPPRGRVYVVPAPPPGYGMAPYPYGYPYSPRAAVLGNPYVPPFVKRMLNGVLPY